MKTPEELTEYAQKISLKFRELPEHIKNKINHENLISSTKHVINIINPEKCQQLFDKYCLIKNPIDYKEVIEGLGLVIAGFWTFIQVDPNVINKDAYSFKKVLHKKRTIPRIYREINFTTISNYNFYLDMSEIKLQEQELSKESIEKSLKQLEGVVNEHKTTK